MKKIISIFLSATFALIAFSGCSKIQLEEALEKTAESDFEASADYISVYKNYLKGVIKGKNNPFYVDEDDDLNSKSYRFGLHYFNDDDIPDLFLSEGTIKHCQVIILTCEDGEIKELGTVGRYGEVGYLMKTGIAVEDYTLKCHDYFKLLKYENGQFTEIFCAVHVLGGYPHDDTPEGYRINDEDVDEAAYKEAIRAKLTEIDPYRAEVYSNDILSMVKYTDEGSHLLNNENIEMVIK